MKRSASALTIAVLLASAMLLRGARAEEMSDEEKALDAKLNDLHNSRQMTNRAIDGKSTAADAKARAASQAKQDAADFKAKMKENLGDVRENFRKAEEAYKEDRFRDAWNF